MKGACKLFHRCWYYDPRGLSFPLPVSVSQEAGVLTIRGSCLVSCLGHFTSWLDGLLLVLFPGTSACPMVNSTYRRRGQTLLGLGHWEDERRMFVMVGIQIG